MASNMDKAIIEQLHARNLRLAEQMLLQHLVADYFPDLGPDRIFSISQDPYYNLLILTGYDDFFIDRFITHMGSKLDKYVTDVYRQVGKFGILHITDDMMNQVYERMR